MNKYFENKTLLTDFYELTMMNGYLEESLADKTVYFEYYFRSLPDKAGFAISCGLLSFIEYIKKLKFTKSDIDYIKSKPLFSEKFSKRLENFSFTGDVWSVEEGTPVFPKEPIVVVRASVFEAQLIETALLLFFNHQSLMATKSSRIVRAALGKTVMEFGARRAQGIDASIMGARAAYIAGCKFSSNSLADKLFDVPASGTMAHSWIQFFDSELEAFTAYARTYPDNCNLLVDTYDVLYSGIPNAIKVFDTVLKPMGKRPSGIRIDSGDIAYLSKKSRELLDRAGYEDCKIVVSNSLDEYIIRDLLLQGAEIDAFGVGERLITSKSSPVFGGVYKMVALEKNGEIINKIKISENVEKITTPGFKKVYRIFNKDTNKAVADLITLYDEEVDESKPLEIFDEKHTWKRKTIKNFYTENLLKRIFKKGKLVYKVPSLEETRTHCLESLDYLWKEVKRFDNPHTHIVDLSQKLWDLKHTMIEETKKQIRSKRNY